VTERNKKFDQTESGSKHTPDDYSIYPHRDHIKVDAMPFKLADYGDEGALTEDQIQTISARHRLSIEQARELSRLVGYSLDVETTISLVSITRATVESRLRDRKLGRRNRDKQLDASEANALFESFGLKVVVESDAEPTTSNSEQPKASKPLNVDAEHVSLDEARRILQPDDRRKERDNRRLFVVESCCYIALDAGWSLTYTTDSSLTTNQRGGRLISLMKDVIAMVTVNSQRASVHTLKSDIELVRRRFHMRGDLTSDSAHK
jgi:hypothetical protein